MTPFSILQNTSIKTNFLRTTFLLLLTLGFTNVFCQQYYLFIGTYTDSGSKGIYVYSFNTSTGKTQWISNTDSVVNPSYLAVSSNHKFVYAVNETNHDHPGSVSAFAFEQRSGKLNFIDQQPTGGDDPCYISLTKNNRWALVANYSGGSVTALPININGSLERYAQLIQDSGKSINKERQEGSHVHQVVLSTDEQYVFTPNLGTDKLMIYKFNTSATYPLKKADQPYYKAKDGNGPRHFTFSPDRRHAYLIQELSGTITAFDYHSGKLHPIQTIATHPETYKGMPGSADIHVSPDGKFVYASNRGDENNIAIFAVQQGTGKLKAAGYANCGGKTPRNFIIESSGKYVLVANQNSNNIVVFKRDKLTGMLAATGEEINVPKPVCIQMITKSKL